MIQQLSKIYRAKTAAMKKREKTNSYPKEKILNFFKLQIPYDLIIYNIKPKVDFFTELQQFLNFETTGTSFNSTFILIYINKFLQFLDFLSSDNNSTYN